MCAVILAFLSITSSDLYANQVYTVTASIYCDAPQPITARLDLPASSIVLASESELQAKLDYDQPATLNWRIRVLPDAPRNRLNSIVLVVNDRRLAFVDAVVRCSSALDPMCRKYNYLPIVAVQ
jgi:hypothetical protein